MAENDVMNAADGLPQVCGVVGGGRMGAGIAHALLLAGCEVELVERDGPAAATAHKRVERAVFASAKRGILEDPDNVMTHLRVGTSYADLGKAGLAVEAVPEVLALKLETLGAIEAAIGPETVIATNTSSMSLGALGGALTHPQRFVGLHFFNPVPASRLVEIVVAEATHPQIGERAVRWVEQLGKTPVVVRDSPGFASSRLGVALGLEAIRMVEDGVASAADIDAAMTLGYGHPTGPLRLTDLVGIDVRLGIARYLEHELGPRFAPPQLMVQMVEQGDLGRKSGRGFYDWPDENLEQGTP